MNRPLLRARLGRALAAALLLALALGAAVLHAARPAGDEPEIPRVRELIRLDGSTPNPSPLEVLRVAAFDASLGAMHGSPSFAWRPAADYAVWVNHVADAVELLRPDILLITGVLLDGDRAGGARFVSTIAAEGDLHWQAIFPRLDRRFSIWPTPSPSKWLGRGVVGDVILSRVPITSIVWEPSGRASRRIDASPAPGLARAVLACGEGCRLAVELQSASAELGGADELGEFTQRVRLVVDGEEPCALRGDDGHLCLRIDGPLDVLRTVTHARFHDTVVHNSVFAELRRTDLGAPAQ